MVLRKSIGTVVPLVTNTQRVVGEGLKQKEGFLGLSWSTSRRVRGNHDLRRYVSLWLFYGYLCFHSDDSPKTGSQKEQPFLSSFLLLEREQNEEDAGRKPTPVHSNTTNLEKSVKRWYSITQMSNFLISFVR